MKQFNIAINGQKAVDVARAFIGPVCYRGIYNHGKRIAQVEVVVDEPGTYKGLPNKWVDVTDLNRRDIETVVNQLSRLGFSGCPCMIQSETVTGCLVNSTDLCCFII